MADKIIGIKIVIDGEKEISDLDKELIKVNKELKALQAEQKKLNKDISDVDKSSKAYDDLIKEEIELKRKIKEAAEAQKELNKNFEYTKTAVGSYNELQGELRQLTKEFKAMSEAEREADVGKNTAERINEVKGKLKEIDKGIGDNFRNVGNYTESINESFAGLKSGFTEAFEGFSAASAGAFAANAVIDFIKGSVSAYNEAEAAAAKLENVIVTIGGESVEALQRLQEQADKLELETFGFTAEQIQNSQAALSVFGLTTQEIEKLVPLIADYATVTGKDLAAATEDVKNALLGKTKALEEVGIHLDKDNISVETLTTSMKKFEGSAAKALDVGANRTEILTDRLGMLQEAVGGYLVEIGLFYVDIIEKIVGITNRVMAGIGQTSETSSKAIKGFVNFFSGATFRKAVGSGLDWLNRVTMSADEREAAARGEWDERGAIGGKGKDDTGRFDELRKGLTGGKGTRGGGGLGSPTGIKKEAEEVKAAADSYEELNKQLRDARDKYEKLSEAQRKGAEGQNIIQQTVQIKQQIDIINAEIKNAEVQAEQEKREAIKQEKYKTFGEIKKLNELYESEGVQSIETNTTKQIETIFKESEKIIAANNKAAEEQYQAEQETRAKIETAKNELQAQVFDMALLLSKAYEDSRLQQIQEAYNAENEALKLALDKKKITQEQYNAEKEANDKELAEKEIAIRKKLAAVTKTITIAEIAINLAKELSQINSNVGVNADLTQTLRIVLTAAAVGRAALQTATVLAQKFAKGGIINGASHDNGGVRGYISGQEIELEGGEAVINKRSTEMFKPLLSEINAAGGGKRFAAGGVIPYAYTNQNGTLDAAQFMELIKAVNGRIDRLQVIQSVSELTSVQDNQKKLYQSSRI